MEKMDVWKVRYKRYEAVEKSSQKSEKKIKKQKSKAGNVILTLLLLAGLSIYVVTSKSGDLETLLAVDFVVMSKFISLQAAEFWEVLPVILIGCAVYILLRKLL